MAAQLRMSLLAADDGPCMATPEAERAVPNGDFRSKLDVF